MRTNLSDTIVSISTALANGAISIIRLSGEDALNIVNSCFKGDDLTLAQSHTIHYGHIYDGDELIDEVLVSVFLPPRSYTKEKVVEINCHGGIYVTNKVYELLLSKGARSADAGEFTKRAFLNGRIDLTQAEAVMDMIEAQTKTSLKMAGFGLSGSVKELINSIRTKILEVIVLCEVNIDYPEYEEAIFNKKEILNKLNEALSEINKILARSDEATKLRYGINTAIIGKPNVGKSSILNALLEEDKAIVSSIAGTTRDTIEADLNIGGVILHLIDTAGIRETDDEIEQIGVVRAYKKLDEAKLVILVFDNSSELTIQDLDLLEETKDKPRVIIVNKSDLVQKLDYSKIDSYLLVSSFNHDDIEKIKKEIIKVCSISDASEIDETFVSSARQIGLIRNAKDSLIEAISLINDDREIDLITQELYSSYDYISSVVGEGKNIDFVDEIFKRFCLGK